MQGMAYNRRNDRTENEAPEICFAGSETRIARDNLLRDIAFVMRMLVEIVLQGLVTVRNGRILIETVQAMKQCFFERDVPAAESLYVIQATGFQSVFERCKIFRFSPNPHIP